MIRTIIQISELWQPTDYTGWPLNTVLLNAGSTVPRSVLFVGFRGTKNVHTCVSQFHKYEMHSIFSPSWKCSSHRWIQPQMLRRNNRIKSISQCTLINVNPEVFRSHFVTSLRKVPISYSRSIVAGRGWCLSILHPLHQRRNRPVFHSLLWFVAL